MLGQLQKGEYYELVRDMLNFLKPAKLAVETLNNRNANLLKAKAFLSFY
jgi:hypothetical protein